MIIRTQARQQSLANVARPSKKKRVTRKKQSVRPSTIALYGGAFVAIVAVIASGYRVPQSTTTVANIDTSSGQADQHASVNEVIATSIAANVAETAGLPVAANVANLSVSLAIKNDLTTSNNTESVTKQDIVQPTGDRRELTTYVAKSGDTVAKIAKEYGVSSETIKWANDLTGEKLAKGKKIVVPPVDGVVHSVSAGDTVEKLAKKYKTSEARIIAFNDLELSGIKGSKKIIIPAGSLPENERPGYTPPTPSYTSSTSSVTLPSFRAGNVGNRYAPGWCTWYAYERRPDIGSFWGNANTWDISARAAGFTVVTGVPKAGAIFQYGAGGFGGGYGHVGIVESVNEKAGTMVISDMNGIAGFNQIGRDTVPINKSWKYIY